MASLLFRDHVHTPALDCKQGIASLAGDLTHRVRAQANTQSRLGSKCMQRWSVAMKSNSFYQ